MNVQETSRPVATDRPRRERLQDHSMAALYLSLVSAIAAFWPLLVGFVLSHTSWHFLVTWLFHSRAQDSTSIPHLSINDALSIAHSFCVAYKFSSRPRERDGTWHNNPTLSSRPHAAANFKLPA